MRKKAEVPCFLHKSAIPKYTVASVYRGVVLGDSRYTINERSFCAPRYYLLAEASQPIFVCKTLYLLRVHAKITPGHVLLQDAKPHKEAFQLGNLTNS